MWNDLGVLFLSVLALILVSRFLGRLAMSLGQPSIIGEIFAGIMLGPALLGLIKPSSGLSAISTVAVFMIVFSAGLEMELSKIVAVLRQKGILVALFSFVIPLCAGLGIGMAFHLGTLHSWILGLVMAVTALPVAVRILETFGLLDSIVGSYTIVIAVVNDIVVFLALTLAMQASRSASSSGIFRTGGLAVGKLGLLILLIWVCARALYKMKPGKFGGRWGYGCAVALGLGFGLVSMALGFHFAIGAFFGALILRADLFGARQFEEFRGLFRRITSLALAPVFFGCVGLATVVKGLPSLGFVAAVILFSIFSKILAGWLVGWGGERAF